MMIHQLVMELKDAGVDLWEENGALRYRAPAGAMSAERLERLRQGKAAVLDYLAANDASSVTPDREHLHEPFPLTDLQSAYLMGRGDAFDLGGVACHGYLEFEFAALDVARLETAWRSLIARHDMLRAIVSPDGSQRILADVPAYVIEVADARGRAEAGNPPAVEGFRSALSHRKAATDRWPLIELKATLEDRRATLHVSIDLLVCDFQSARLLLGQLSAAYFDGAAGSPPSISFRDHVLAERRRKEDARFQRDQGYWLQRIESLPPAPALPAGTGGAAPRFSRKSFVLHETDFQALGAHAGRHDIGVSPALLTAYAEVIGRWSAQSAFTLSLTTARRETAHPEIDAVVGDFSSVELLGVTLDPQRSFAEQARALQEQLWADLDHPNFSGIDVLRELARRRGRDAALFPVAFTSAIAGGSECRAALFPGAKQSFGITQTPQVAIDCQIGPGEDGLTVNWDIRDGAVPDDVIQPMFEAFEALVRSLCRDATAWTAPAAIDLPSDQRARRARVNGVTRPLPTGLLQDPVFEQAAKAPERIAVIDLQHTDRGPVQREITYGELAGRADAVAATLRRSGCAPGDLVAVAMDKGIDQIVAVLGVLRAGAAYLPLDLGQPRARRDVILTTASVTHMLTHSDIAPRLEPPATVDHVIAVDRIEAAEQDGRRHDGAVTDLAYVIFTSGSTGTPKGVMIDHRGARNTIDDINERFAIGAADRVFGLANLGFDLSVFDIFGVLGAGGTLVLPDPSRRSDPSHWAERLTACGVTLWNSVPAQLEMLTDYLRGDPGHRPRSLRLAMLSGDWIPVSLPARIRHFLPDLELIGLGGATEASIWSIFHRIGTVPPEWKSIPYGKPLANQTFHVLDEALRPCPDLVAGELYIGGHGLALGYLGDREKTDERFFRHPLTGERLYRTGDFGRYLSDGSIEFLGRQDLQVKIRGHRIEIAEVEAALADHPDVAGAAVLVQGEDNRDRRLVAFATAVTAPHRLHALPDLPEVVDAAAGQLVAGLDMAKVSALAAGIERVSLLSMAAALDGQGVFSGPGPGPSADEVLRACAVSPRNRRLIRRWLRALVREGFLTCDETGRHRRLRPVDRGEIDGLWSRIEDLAWDVDWGGEVLRYVRSSQEVLGGLMRDEVDPLHLLFPEGETIVAEAAYRNNLVSRHMNGLVCAIIRHIALSRKAGGTGGGIRLLEAGAGVGGTSMELIPRLDGCGVEYHFTDVSQYFLNAAESRLGAFPWVRFGLFDINADPIAQGIEPNTVDVILCANVLHNSRDVADVLRRLREILAPGGWLVFIEATSDSYQIMSSMEFKEGLTDFEDCRRALDTTFLSCGQWEDQLRLAGAATVLRFPGDGGAMSDVGQHVFAAQFKPDRMAIPAAELRRHASERLPEHMVPAEIHILDSLPVTENGKIDRKALAGLAPKSRRTAAAAGSMPRDDLEREIAAVWASVLRLESVGIDQNFFDLGGDSLLVAQVVGRLRECLPKAAGLEWDVLLRRLLNQPTVAALADLLRGAGGPADDGLSLIDLRQGDGKGPTLLFVHDGSGTIVPYRSLLDRPDGDVRRILGLAIQDPAPFLAMDPACAISELADGHVGRIVTALSPGERLHIVGYCLGGLLATEIAQRLAQRGIAVERLSVISSYRVPFLIEDDILAEYVFARVMRADPAVLGYPADEAGMRRLIGDVLAETPGRVGPGSLERAAASRGGDAASALLILASRGQDERLEAIARHMRHAGTDFASLERVKSQYELIRHSLAAVARHEGRPYSGDMTFIRQTGEVQVLPGMHDDMSAYWAALCSGRLRIADVPGDHFSCLSPPNVGAVAAALGLDKREPGDGR